MSRATMPGSGAVVSFDPFHCVPGIVGPAIVIDGPMRARVTLSLEQAEQVARSILREVDRARADK